MCACGAARGIRRRTCAEKRVCGGCSGFGNATGARRARASICCRRKREGENLAQFFGRKNDGVGLHAAGARGLFGERGDIGRGDAIGGERRDCEAAAEIGGKSNGGGWGGGGRARRQRQRRRKRSSEGGR